MSIASVSSRSCAECGPAKGVGSGQWSGHAISGCTSTGLSNQRAGRPVGYFCPPSIRQPFPWRSQPSPKSRGWGHTSTCSWSWIRRAGTRVPRCKFPKDCICSFCHRTRQNCSQRNACGPSPMSPWPIGFSLRLTSWNRSRLNAVAGYKLIQKSFEGAPPFIGGLLL
jgi:hypothetical protein